MLSVIENLSFALIYCSGLCVPMLKTRDSFFLCVKCEIFYSKNVQWYFGEKVWELNKIATLRLFYFTAHAPDNVPQTRAVIFRQNPDGQLSASRPDAGQESTLLPPVWLKVERVLLTLAHNICNGRWPGKFLVAFHMILCGTSFKNADS